MKYLATILIVLAFVLAISVFGKRDDVKESFVVEPEVMKLVSTNSDDKRVSHETPKFSNRHIEQMKRDHRPPLHEHVHEVKLNPPQGDYHDKHYNNQFDQTFKNVKKYSNEEGVWGSGYRKCLVECPGTCVEFGFTNNGTCFLGDSSNEQTSA